MAVRLSIITTGSFKLLCRDTPASLIHEIACFSRSSTYLHSTKVVGAVYPLSEKVKKKRH